MTAEATKTVLSEAARKQIDAWLKRYPAEQKRSGVLEALRIVQAENGGYLTNALMDAVANHLDLPKIAVYEVATFYDMYHLDPVGKNVIHVCTNVSCMMNGSDDLVEHLRERLGIDFDGITDDGEFTIKEVECLGACVGAPACMVNESYHESVTPKKLDELIDKLKQKK